MTDPGVTENLFIGIAGIIGAGKSTLGEYVAEVLGLQAYFEPVSDQEYLEDFYRDMKRYSFAMQVYLLNRRFEQCQQIIWQKKGGVQDRTIYEDSVFAKMLMEAGLMDKRDYETYVRLFSNMSNFMRKPNLIIYLDVEPEESLKRIAQRERSYEKCITIEYLRMLKAAYEKFIAEISKVIPVIRVDWNQMRPVKDVAKGVLEEYKKLRVIRTVDFN